MQAIKFTPHFFLEILERYCSKHVILANLRMPGQNQQKWQYQFVENFDVYLHAKNKLQLSPLPYGYFGHAYPDTPKIIVSL